MATRLRACYLRRNTHATGACTRTDVHTDWTAGRSPHAGGRVPGAYAADSAHSTVELEVRAQLLYEVRAWCMLSECGVCTVYAKYSMMRRRIDVSARVCFRVGQREW